MPPGCGTLAAEGLGRICTALGWSSARHAQMVGALERLWASWWDAEVRAPAGYRSNISPDGTPFELSVSWDGQGPEVLVDFEAMGEQPTARSCQEAGRTLITRLGALAGVSIGHYLRVDDLFTSPDPRGLFPLWHGVAWRADGDPQFRVYLNPLVHGPARGRAVLDEALSRLQVGLQWQRVADELDRVTRSAWEPIGLALDLVHPACFGVRVYVVHPGLDAVAVTRQTGLTAPNVSDQLDTALRGVTGAREPDKGLELAPVIVYSLLPGDGAVPVKSVSIDIPVPRPESDGDMRVAGRVTRLLAGEGLDPRPYSRVLTVLTGPAADVPMRQSMVSYRPATALGQRSRVATYFASDAPDGFERTATTHSALER